LSTSVIVFLLGCVLVDDAAGQIRLAEFEIHARGEVWETMKDDGTIGAPNPTNQFEFFPSMDWPGGPSELSSKDEQRSYHAGAGLWMGGFRADGGLFFTENGPFNAVDDGSFEPIERTTNFVEDAGYDPSEAEEIITAGFTTSEGVRVQRVSRTWSFAGLNNFILIEYLLTNQNAGPLTEVFVGFPYLLRPSYQDFVVHNGWGDDFNRTDEFVGYDAARRLVYAWDDTPNQSLPTDVGNYWGTFDEMRTTGYIGVSLLEAPATVDARQQPSTLLWAQLLNNERLVTIENASPESLYDVLSGQDESLQAAPGEHLTPFVLMGTGPYTIEPAETLRFVLVQAVGGLPIEEALKGLAVQADLGVGLDSLRNAVDRARALFDNGYEVTGVPPPSPVIQVIPLPASRSISITWDALEETWVDPLNPSAEFREYHVLRSDRSFVGPYTSVGRVRPNSSVDRTRWFDESSGIWKFLDNRVSLGVSYFYAVVSLDDEGHASWLTNRNEEPIRVSSLPAENALDVRVFPNPFRLVSGFPTTGEESTIVWNNLPEQATIRVYTSDRARQPRIGPGRVGSDDGRTPAYSARRLFLDG
jgi:hypothetical protein